MPKPTLSGLEKPFNLLVTGVGGTGVITVGALIAMAAHLEGKGASVLDFTGFAQKFGPVLSFIRLSNRPDDIHQVRIDQGAADALIGCDIVVSSSPKASVAYGPAMRAVVNTAEMPTGDVVRNRDASLCNGRRLRRIERLSGARQSHELRRQPSRRSAVRRRRLRQCHDAGRGMATGPGSGDASRR